MVGAVATSLHLSHLHLPHLLVATRECISVGKYRMEPWRARLAAAQQQFMEDDEHDEVKMQQALDQLQDNINEDILPQRRAGGSQRGKAQNIDRERIAMDERMLNNYFLDTPTYGPVHFCRQYQMRRSLFLTIIDTRRKTR
jgi:hypothetical protein